MTSTSKPVFSFFIIGGLIAGAIALLLLPADFFDAGPPTCLSVLLFKQTCYGCGMTRACQHLIHFQFQDAWEFNPLSFLVFPVLLYGVGTETWVHAKKIHRWWKDSQG